MNKQIFNNIIEKYNLTGKISFDVKRQKLIILGQTRRSSKDYANILNVAGEIEEITKTSVEIDQQKNVYDFDDSEWD